MSSKILFLSESWILVKQIMKRFKSLESEDTNFIQGIIDGALLECGIDLTDPLACKVNEMVYRNLNKT